MNQAQPPSFPSFGRYQPVRPIGSGAFATVWLAFDESLDSQVAVKVLAENWSRNDEMRNCFVEEARLLRRLDSDHLVRVYDIGHLEDGRPYFVMTWADHGTLAVRIDDRQGEPFELEVATDIVSAVLSALGVLHAKGIAHGDVSPPNVLFRSAPASTGAGERVLLGDLGLAKDMVAGSGVNGAAGTPGYLAPEQRRPGAEATPLSDLYATGCILAQLLRGSLAIDPEHPLADLPRSVPVQLADLLARAVSADPLDRPSTAAAMAQALHDCTGVPGPNASKGPPSGAGPAPSGFVTFLFTDIEGSTARWEVEPQAMSAALGLHDAILRQAIENQRGYVFKTVGDAFCATFDTPQAAIQATLDAQRRLHQTDWPTNGPIRCRMALHTGTAEERDNDYFGPTVNRSARLEAIAHGGQVIVSGVTAELVAATVDGLGDASATVGLRDMGRHRLKDLEQPEQVFQLVASDLPSDFPPLRSLDNPELQHNLPAHLSPFVGRAGEVEVLHSLVLEKRLVTVTGPGGSGKTRLSLQVTADVLDGFGDGVWFIDLAPLTDTQRVPLAAADALHLQLEAGVEPVEALVGALRSRDTLVVLDNCEHVINEVAVLADRVVRACPGVVILATSREPLGVDGEHVYRMGPLRVPAPDESSFDELASSDAVALFAARAATHDASFVLDPQNAPHVAAICRRVDGIPLAIELAAARMSAMSAAQLSARLGDRLRLLTGRSRVAAARQQTLRATIDWSYDLLSAPERVVLAELATFAGGWTLEAAESVCAVDGVEAYEVLDLLTSLVDKSLVQIDRNARGDSRYRLLETIREYAEEKLIASGSAPDARDRHAVYFHELVETAADHLEGPDELLWTDRVEEDEPNIYGAIHHLLMAEDGPPLALHMVAGLRAYWMNRSGYLPHQDLITSVLEHPVNREPSEARSWVLFMAARNALDSEPDPDSGLRLCDQAVAAARAVDESALLAIQLARQTWISSATGEYPDPDTASADMDRAIECARLSGDRSAIFSTLWSSSLLLNYLGEQDQAIISLQQAVVLGRSMRFRSGTAQVLGFLVELEIEAQLLEDARTHVTEAVALADELQWQGWGRAYLLTCIAQLALVQEQWSEAYEAALAALKISHSIADSVTASWAIEFLALASAHLAPRLAAYLLGARDHLVQTGQQWTEQQFEKDRRRLVEENLRAEIGNDAYTAAFEEGRCIRSVSDVLVRLKRDGG